MATIRLTADELIAENIIKLKTISITDFVTTISDPGVDTKLATEKAIVTFANNLKYRVKVDSSDTTGAYLASKLDAGSGVSLTVLHAGANETVEIKNTIRKIISLEDYSPAAEPTNDKILYWDNANTTWTELAIGTNLSISGNTLNAAGSSGTPVDYRAGIDSLVANTVKSITFSSSLGSVASDFILQIDGRDSSGNKVAIAITNKATTGFDVEAAVACDIEYYAVLTK